MWYGRVLLFFKFKLMHDDGHIREAECAMIDVFYKYADGRYQRLSAHLETTVYLSAHLKTKLNFACTFF